MATAKIWYREPFVGWPKPPTDLSNYRYVGNVETPHTDELDNLEDVFSRVQNIDDVRNVELEIGKSDRSFSVGDMIEIDGEFWFCEMLGWKKVEI